MINVSISLHQDYLLIHSSKVNLQNCFITMYICNLIEDISQNQAFHLASILTNESNFINHNKG